MDLPESELFLGHDHTIQYDGIRRLVINRSIVLDRDRPELGGGSASHH